MTTVDGINVTITLFNPNINVTISVTLYNIHQFIKLLPDQFYVYTFHATGCPNGNPWLDWWKNQTKGTVLNDMFIYCNRTRHGNATESQKYHCCGTDDCTVNICAKQTEWITGT